MYQEDIDDFLAAEAGRTVGRSVVEGAFRRGDGEGVASTKV